MSCHNNEQCSHTPHALCLQRKCGCTEGYFAFNSTECLQGVYVNIIHKHQTLYLAY